MSGVPGESRPAQDVLFPGGVDPLMCMRCGKRTGLAPEKGGCACRQEREECISLMMHGAGGTIDTPDAVFPDYIHRICFWCKHPVKDG